MTPTETAAILRQLNAWRRGDKDIPQPDLREIGKAIDAAVEMIDRIEAAEQDAAHQKALADSALRVAKGWEEKCNALRAKIEAMERQEPVGYMPLATKAALEAGGTGVVWNCRDRGIADEPLYALPGAQSAPSVPIGWLDEADFRALQQGNSVWLHTEDQGRMIPVCLAAAPEASHAD